MPSWIEELLSQGPWAVGLYVFLRIVVKEEGARAKAMLEAETIRLGELREELRSCILETTRKADEQLLLQFTHQMRRHSRRFRAIERRLGIVDNPAPEERDPDPEDTIP